MRIDTLLMGSFIHVSLYHRIPEGSSLFEEAPELEEDFIYLDDFCVIESTPTDDITCGDIVDDAFEHVVYLDYPVASRVTHSSESQRQGVTYRVDASYDPTDFDHGIGIDYLTEFTNQMGTFCEQQMGSWFTGNACSSHLPYYPDTLIESYHLCENQYHVSYSIFF